VNGEKLVELELRIGKVEALVEELRRPPAPTIVDLEKAGKMSDLARRLRQAVSSGAWFQFGEIMFREVRHTDAILYGRLNSAYGTKDYDAMTAILADLPST
jgi:hypothetical protein